MKKPTACLLGLSATSQQYFYLTTNQPPATSQQYFSLRTNQHQPPATSQTNRLQVVMLLHIRHVVLTFFPVLEFAPRHLLEVFTYEPSKKLLIPY
jgi:hypothetical protein